MSAYILSGCPCDAANGVYFVGGPYDAAPNLLIHNSGLFKLRQGNEKWSVEGIWGDEIAHSEDQDSDIMSLRWTYWRGTRPVFVPEMRFNRTTLSSMSNNIATFKPVINNTDTKSTHDNSMHTKTINTSRYENVDTGAESGRATNNEENETIEFPPTVDHTRYSSGIDAMDTNDTEILLSAPQSPTPRGSPRSPHPDFSDPKVQAYATDPAVVKSLLAGYGFQNDDDHSQQAVPYDEHRAQYETELPREQDRSNATQPSSEDADGAEARTKSKDSDFTFYDTAQQSPQSGGASTSDPHDAASGDLFAAIVSANSADDLVKASNAGVAPSTWGSRGQEWSAKCSDGPPKAPVMMSVDESDTEQTAGSSAYQQYQHQNQHPRQHTGTRHQQGYIYSTDRYPSPRTSDELSTLMADILEGSAYVVQAYWTPTMQGSTQRSVQSSAVVAPPAKPAKPNNDRRVPTRSRLAPYQRRIPQLVSSHKASEWRKVSSFLWGTEYVNTMTGERLDYAPSSRPNVASYWLPLSDEQQVLAFAPTSAIGELGKAVQARACVEHWEYIAQYWSSTVASYEYKTAAMEETHRHREEELRDAYDKREQEFVVATSKEMHEIDQERRASQQAVVKLQEQVEKLKAELAESKEREAASSKRADVLMTRVGKNHIKRDWQQSGVQHDFPAGEDIRNEFQSAFLNFESFACDAINCLEDAGDANATGTFVRHVMSSIFSETQSYVQGKLKARRAILKEQFGVNLRDTNAKLDDSVPRLFWYQTQQDRMPGEIKSLTDEDIMQLIGSMDEKVLYLHQLMLKAAEVGVIDNGTQNMRIPQLVRILLRLHTVTTLSDPRCYLHPAPGQTEYYRESNQTEILSPGAKKHGRIQENDVVEVVLPGLYFDAPGGSAKPTLPPLVRRTVTTMPYAISTNAPREASPAAASTSANI